MTPHARILVTERPTARPPRIGEALASSGCDVTAVPALDDVPFRAAQDRPDVVVLDGGLPKAARRRATHALHRDIDTRDIPILVVGADPEDEEDMATLDQVLPRPFAAPELVSRVHALRRLGTMRHELARRMETAQKFGFTDVVESGLAAGPSRFRILALDPDVGDVATLRSAIGPRGSVEIACGADAPSLLGATSHDAAVVFAGADAAAALETCEAVRRMPNLFHFPLIVVGDTTAFADPTAPYRHGASDVVARPLDGGGLRARLEALVRQERFRHWLQDAYRNGKGMAVTDTLTGLYRLGFAHEHLDAMIKDVGGAAHPLAVGVIRVLDVDAINKAKGHATGDRVLQQAGAMIGRLVRAEDIAARIGGTTFGIILPDTREPAASAVCRRIAGVVGSTDFGLGEMNPLRLTIGCTEADPTDSSTTLFARAAASPI